MALASPLGGTTGRFLWALVLRHRGIVALVVVCGLLAAAFEGSTMAVFVFALHLLTGGERPALADEYGRWGEAADRLAGALGRGELFLTLVALAIACQLLRSGFRFSADRAAGIFQSRVEGEVRGSLFRQFMQLSHTQLRSYKVGDLATYMGQVNYLGQVIYRLNVIVGHLLLLGAYLVVVVWLSFKGTLIAASLTVLASLSLRRLVSRIQRNAEAYKNAFVAVSERTVEFLNGARLLHTFAREQWAIDCVDEQIERSVAARRRGVFWQSLVSPLLDSLAVLGIGGFLVGGYLVLGGPLESGDVARYAAFLFVIFRLAPRVSAINKTWGIVNNYLPFTRRIALFLRRDDKELCRTGGVPHGGLKQAVEFQRVSLVYPGREAPAVDRISFRLAKGEMLALVGESGSGKSTIADLLLRLLDPTGGRILVDGLDLAELDWESWRKRIGMVSQETFLFNSSIRENIAFGKLQVSEAEIVEAACAAHAHEFIAELPRGYETVIGDRGHRLSGGQRQRLAIARAILRDPEILVLDEATSDLDSRSERLIEESLARLSSDRTVLAVAHRLSTVARADRILMLDGGRILEQGSHAELLRVNGAYAASWRLQAGGAGRPASETVRRAARTTPS